jgi:ApaG protein
MKNIASNSHTGAYSQTTNDVRVTVAPTFIKERSDLKAGIYVFVYEVTIENHSQKVIQLLNRHWVVMSGGRQYADIKGDGVVGEQPVFEPGTAYTYTSFTVIDSQFGSMLGSYTFRSQSGEFFDVSIPEFDLIYADDQVVH